MLKKVCELSRKNGIPSFEGNKLHGNALKLFRSNQCVLLMTNSLKVERDGAILRVAFNRPEKKNAIDNAMWIALKEIFLESREDDKVRCVLLTGVGENFSAGVDLASFDQASSEAQHPFESAARAVADFNKPLIAAVKGVAVGGGATILFHADIVYVSKSLRMRLPFASLALAPEWGSSYMLQANIGAQRAAELFFTAQWIDSDLAVSYGLAAGAFADDELLARADAKALEICRWPASVLCEIKECLRAHHKPHIDLAFQLERDAMARLAGSPDNIEAISALFEKRDPDFNRG